MGQHKGINSKHKVRKWYMEHCMKMHKGWEIKTKLNFVDFVRDYMYQDFDYPTCYSAAWRFLRYVRRPTQFWTQNLGASCDELNESSRLIVSGRERRMQLLESEKIIFGYSSTIQRGWHPMMTKKGLHLEEKWTQL